MSRPFKKGKNAFPRQEEDPCVLSRQIIQAQEEQHERMSREIHDDLGQSLATLKMLIQEYRAQFACDQERTQVKSFRKIIGYLDEIIEKTRNLAAGLRPATLEVLGLSAALRALVNEFRYKKGLKMHLRCPPLDDLVLTGEPINLYRIVQEALTNSIRHASATRVSIIFRETAGRLRVCIKDNGRGFPAGYQAGKISSGLGFSTMRERSRLLGGSLEVKTGPGKGTEIRVEIPVKKK